jgi:hypothetical protein
MRKKREHLKPRQHERLTHPRPRPHPTWPKGDPLIPADPHVCGVFKNIYKARKIREEWCGARDLFAGLDRIEREGFDHLAKLFSARAEEV